ncbi:MAG: phosphatase PAP2 family protein [Bryobacteraceae bacterium]
MRTSEWINVVVFSFLGTLAWFRPLSTRARMKICTAAGAGLCATAIGSHLLPRILSPLATSVCRDWLPSLLMVMVYWQAGQFANRVDEQVQRKLVRLDERLVLPLLADLRKRRLGAWLLTILEIAYLFCYPMVPLSLAALYIMRMGRQADHFWTVVLAASYTCYVAFPFIQTLPPRMLAEQQGVPLAPGGIRIFNLWILRHASIHANTFPSAHVAASMACALVLLRLAPGVGVVFLLVAACIALGAVAGRYHYAADAILGALVAMVAFVIARL